ncbi:MAG: mechanosensitive ion channel family protein [Candidatus Woesearchaeota archaeon]
MFEYIIFGNTIENYIIAISIMLLFLGAGQLVSKVIVRILKKAASKTDTIFDDVMISILEKPAVFALFIIGFKMMGLYLNFGTRGQQIHANILTILIIINIIWAATKLMDAIIEHYLRPLTSKTKSRLDDQLLPFVRKFLKVVIILIGVIFLIKNMGYDVTSLVAGLGIGGLAFALAAQPLLSNLFGGLAIISDKPFQMGDRVRVDQKYEGYVKEIGMRSTIISTPTGTMITIPNNLIATTTVENLSTSEDHGVKFTFEIGLEYDTSAEKIEEAIDIIKDILKKNKNVVQEGDGAPYISFWDFKDYYLKLSGGYSIHPTNVIGATRTQINIDIKKRFEKAHIHFAFPTQTIHMKKE